MFNPSGKRVLVIGLGASGQAACRLLLRRQAHVTALDAANTPGLRQAAAQLQPLGVQVELGAAHLPADDWDLAILSPGVASASEWVQALRGRGVPVISELELGYRHLHCPLVGITGTNGKTTTTELIERMLGRAGKKTLAAGNIGRPLCDVADQSRELDFVTLEISSFQLETIEFLRPAIAVLLNLTPDHLDRYAGMAEYIRAKARLFRNQLPFDWAVIQSDALAQLNSLGIEVPARVITFSATDPDAQIFLQHDIVQSRISAWPGSWLNLAEAALRGPHNAENIMAALAVGRLVGLDWPAVTTALQSYAPAAHRCELVAEINGIQFVNDSKATNVDAVRQALLTARPDPMRAPNVWLIAGGRDKGFDFDELGPLLSKRVKGVFLLGETRHRLDAAWGRFAPCTLVQTLLEAVIGAAKNAVPGDVVLLSPACSSFDMFQNYQHRGEVFRQAVLNWAGRRAVCADALSP